MEFPWPNSSNAELRNRSKPVHTPVALLHFELIPLGKVLNLLVTPAMNLIVLLLFYFKYSFGIK